MPEIKGKVGFNFDDGIGRIDVCPPEIDEFFGDGEPSAMITIFDRYENEQTIVLDFENFKKLTMLIDQIYEGWNHINQHIFEINTLVEQMNKKEKEI